MLKAVQEDESIDFGKTFVDYDVELIEDGHTMDRLVICGREKA